ncbi:hypothetical protein Bca52824_020585 [Brassica carinata]|uniref:Uncharacterized protein n=1 Tax=Brassica carinata TaxID=52824 RepID=A0A8X7VSU6_BRACI|nr:hypothetical protein Bca52824_020585 [Brassica carinata]
MNEPLWNVDKLRSVTYTQNTLSTSFSCAEAYHDEEKSALEADDKDTADKRLIVEMRKRMEEHLLEYNEPANILATS